MDFNNIITLLLETLGMTLISTLLAYLLGLPIGILLNVTSKNGLHPNRIVNMVLGVIVNVLRSIPCLIILENGIETKRNIGFMTKEELEEFVGD